MHDDHHIWSYVYYIAFLREKVGDTNDFCVVVKSIKCLTCLFVFFLYLSRSFSIRIRRKTVELSLMCEARYVLVDMLKI